MEAHITKEAPALFIDLIGGVVGFIVALGWWKASGRTVDRDSTIFLAKMFGGIALFGMLLAFIM